MFPSLDDRELIDRLVKDCKDNPITLQEITRLASIGNGYAILVLECMKHRGLVTLH